METTGKAFQIETLPYTTDAAWLAARARDLTSTDIAALFGVSPYLTAFELWHRKRDQATVTLEPSERMKWGQRLQAAIADGIAEEQGWEIRRMDEYLRNPTLRIGASFDFSIECSEGEINQIEPCAGGNHLGLLEVKNVDALQYRDGWIVDGDTIEAPPHIELQLQHQLLVSGRAYAYLGALIGGNRVVLQRRAPDAATHAAILKKAAAFWSSIEAGVPPEPDFARDAAFIASFYQYAEPGKVLDATANTEITVLATQYRLLGEDKRKADTGQEIIKAQLLAKIGEAERVNGQGFTISAGVVGPAHVEYERKGYRLFKVSWRKTQEGKK